MMIVTISDTIQDKTIDLTAVNGIKWDILNSIEENMVDLS